GGVVEPGEAAAHPRRPDHAVVERAHAEHGRGAERVDQGGRACEAAVGGGDERHARPERRVERVLVRDAAQLRPQADGWGRAVHTYIIAYRPGSCGTNRGSAEELHKSEPPAVVAAAVRARRRDAGDDDPPVRADRDAARRRVLAPGDEADP